MSWSWKIGRLFGIPLYVHWTFLILIAWIVVGHWMQGHDLTQTAVGVGFVRAIFGCVVLHELGHALTARRFGIPTADITLLPIGGVARLQRMPEKPRQELLVALAGPAVNVVIAAILFAIGARLPLALGTTETSAEALIKPTFASKLLLVNVFLVLFNLLPAFPMDGGRVLRAILAMGLPYPRATRLAASVGQFMAILFGFAGLAVGNPMLLLIAMFVWLGAEAEARQVEERFLLRDAPVRAAMLTEYHTLRPDQTLGHVADLLLAGTQQDFPVVGEAGTTALLTRAGLLRGLSQGGRDLRVADAPLVELGQVDADTQLVPAMAQLRESGQSSLLVTQQGRPTGLLTMENISEMLMVQAALST